MQTKSAKAKGRRLQNWVKACLLFWDFGLYNGDIRTAIIGEQGVDVKIIRNKQHLFPYKIECKSQKNGFSAVYKAYTQCEKHVLETDGEICIGEPLVIIKQDRQKPLAVMDAEYFIKLYDRRLHAKR